MGRLNQQTLAKILADLFVNLSSGWFGILLISPGIFGVSSITGYLRLLTLNLPFGIVGLAIAYWLSERGRKL